MYPTTLLARRVDNDSVAYTLHNVNFGFDILIHATAQLKKDIVRRTHTPYVPLETHFYIRYTHLRLEFGKSAS